MLKEFYECDECANNSESSNIYICKKCFQDLCEDCLISHLIECEIIEEREL